MYTSNSTVIGKAQQDVVDENHPERLLEIYSANKGVAEKYYRIYHTIHALNTMVLRFANIFGPFGKGYPKFGFIDYFIHLARTGQPIKIFGSGSQMRNVLYAEDAADILWIASRQPKLIGQMQFATSDEHLSVSAIARGIVEVFQTGSVEHIEWPDERRRIEIDHVQFSSARLQALTGWKPRHDFLSGLNKTRTIIEGSH